MAPIYAALILIGILAFADYISIITKARVPMLFVSFFTYLILVWIGLPKNLLDISTLGPFGKMTVAVLIVHMGTLIPYDQIKEQWRSIVVALIGLFIAGVFVLLIASPIFGYARAVAGTAPVLGGIIAALVTAEGLKTLGLGSLVVITMTILGIQGLVGLPVASNILKGYGSLLKKKIDQGEISPADISLGKQETGKVQFGTDENPSPRFKAWLPKKYEVDTIMLLKLFIGGSLAFFIGKITHINYSIWALVLGMIGAYFGFYRGKMLNRANSFGITMSALIIYVFSLMNMITFKMFIAQLPVVLIILAIGTVGLIIGGLIGGRLVGWPKALAIPVVLTAEFGFPGDYLISHEVARSSGRNKEEKDFILGRILPAMLVGGYTTVTTTSILIASILIKTIH
jgi:hypothetical protein